MSKMIYSTNKIIIDDRSNETLKLAKKIVETLRKKNIFIPEDKESQVTSMFVSEKVLEMDGPKFLKLLLPYNKDKEFSNKLLNCLKGNMTQSIFRTLIKNHLLSYLNHTNFTPLSDPSHLYRLSPDLKNMNDLDSIDALKIDSNHLIELIKKDPDLTAKFGKYWGVLVPCKLTYVLKIYRHSLHIDVQELIRILSEFRIINSNINKEFLFPQQLLFSPDYRSIALLQKKADLSTGFFVNSLTIDFMFATEKGNKIKKILGIPKNKKLLLDFIENLNLIYRKFGILVDQYGKNIYMNADNNIFTVKLFDYGFNNKNNIRIKEYLYFINKLKKLAID